MLSMLTGYMRGDIVEKKIEKKEPCSSAQDQKGSIKPQKLTEQHFSQLAYIFSFVRFELCTSCSHTHSHI